MRYEPEIKGRIIDFLFTHIYDISALASEVRFADNLRRADLLIIAESVCHAIEVKGPRDSMTKLAKQLQDTQKYFRYTWLACDSAAYTQAKHALPSHIGVLLVARDLTIELIKPPTPRKVTKARLLALVTKLELVEIAKSAKVSSPTSKSLDDLRHAVEARLTRNEIEGMIAVTLNARYQERFEYFLAHKSPSTNADDVYFLEISPTDEIS